MAADGSIQITSLEEAFRRIVLHPGPRRAVVAESLCTREAGAMVKLVKYQAGLQEGDEIWMLSNRRPVERLSKACNLLLLLEGKVLPAVHKRPLDNPPRLARALGRYANRLRSLGAGVGGSFKRESGVVADRIAMFVAQALAHPPFNPDAELREAAGTLLDLVRRLLNSNYTISQENVESEDEEEAAAELEEEEAAAELEEEEEEAELEEAAAAELEEAEEEA